MLLQFFRKTEKALPGPGESGSGKRPAEPDSGPVGIGLEGLYDAHAAVLYRFLTGFLGNEADAADVLQNVFVRLARQDLRQVENLEAYVWTTARNEARRSLSRWIRRRESHGFLQPLPGCVPAPGGQQMVEESLMGLPLDQREVVVLHVFEGLGFREIGERLGISMNTAASRYRYAREKLQKVLS